jgi:hypothetical protein
MSIREDSKSAAPGKGMRGLLFAWGLGLAACAPNVVLSRPPAAQTGTLGPFQRCAPDQKPCDVDPTLSVARLNQGNTTRFSLPSCAYGIDTILVEKVGTPDAIVSAQCAAPPPADPGGIPVASPGGGTSSMP